MQARPSYAAFIRTFLKSGPSAFSLILFNIRLHHRFFVRSVISFAYLSLHPASKIGRAHV